MEMRENYPLETAQDMDTMGFAGLHNMVLKSGSALFAPAQENIILVECFDKKLYQKAITQYPKIRKTLDDRKAQKTKIDYGKKKSQQLNF